MTTQQDVYAAVAARGYVAGWTAEQFAARQAVKLVEELVELVDTVRNAHDAEMVCLLLDAGTIARADFDGVAEWRSVTPVIDRAKFCAELDDLQVVIWCAAEALGHDLEAGALAKARADVGRGTRGGANGQ